MSTINWTLSGTLDTESREGKTILDWLHDRPATPENLRDAFLDAAHAGEGFDPLRGSEIDGFIVHEVDDNHVHSPSPELKLSDTITLPRRCITCGQKDPDGSMK